MSGKLGYSSHIICPRARGVHFRIFLWFSILCSYAAFIKHLLFFFCPGKINILTSKHIRQWSWIQNNLLWETQNMKKKKNLSQKCDIALNCSVHTHLTISYYCVWTELSHCMHCMPSRASAALAQVITFGTQSTKRSISADRKLQIPHGCRIQSLWILLKYVLSEYCHVRSGTT